ncbi:MAG: acyl-CoA thioester hydrolase [Gammaproteobacteria bacterium]|jgi:acyl-CoA thioester hydrolase
MQNQHEIVFMVRDYECDMQGVVNNGVYQNYLEHARHEFLKSRGLNFAEITARKINLVVIRAELDYRASLKSNDRFVVKSSLRRKSRLKFEFSQNIYRIHDAKLILQAYIIGTSVNENGRPFVNEELEFLFHEDP